MKQIRILFIIMVLLLSGGYLIKGCLWINKDDSGSSTPAIPIQIASNTGSFSIILKSDGSLWSWGDNSSGQLGLGDTVSRSFPTRLGVGSNWKTVAGTHALKTDGTLWAWGNNMWGQLGLGDTDNRLSPVQVGTDTDWLTIAPSRAIKTNSTLWAWGDNGWGQLGLGDTVSRTSPTQVGTDTDWKTIAVGNSHNLALKTDGSLWAWGVNNNWELGVGLFTISVTSPTRVGTGTDWAAIAGGSNHSLALKTDGSIWAWGGGFQGQLGQGNPNDYGIPTRVGTDNDCQAIASGKMHSLALKTDGSLWAWGLNGYGQLGVNDIANPIYYLPAQVGTDTDWKVISGSMLHTTMAIKTNNSLWGWGWNSYGELGLGDTTARYAPVRINY